MRGGRRKWTWLAVVIILISLLCLCAGAAAEIFGTCGENLTWVLDDDGTLTISGAGSMDDYWVSIRTAPWMKENVKYVEISDGVTTIGNRAFQDCRQLMEITIPDSVTRIGEYAFYNCNKLTSVSIPGSVTEISAGAFYECDKLAEVTLSEGIVDIGNSAFSVTGLNEIVIPNSVLSIGKSAFYQAGVSELIIGDHVESIGSSAFGRTGMKSVTIPASVTEIGDAVFSCCTNLEDILVDSNNLYYSSVDGVLFDKENTTILAYPGGRTGAYDIPRGVTQIADYAFDECFYIEGITIPDGVVNIGESAFYRCLNLEMVSLPESLTSIGSGAFNYCRELTEISIPNGVTTIAEFAFYNCSTLMEVNLPDSITSIGDYAFYNCTYLETVNYDGTGTQWSNISVGDGNDCLLQAKLIYQSIVLLDRNPATEYSFYYNRGDEITMTVEAECKAGGSPSFRWVDAINGITLENETANSLSVIVDELRLYQYFCYITDDFGSENSYLFTFDFENELELKDPFTQTIIKNYGDIAILRVEASCNEGGLSYSWRDASNVEIGEESDTLSVKVKDQIAYYYCVVEDEFDHREIASFNVYGADPISLNETRSFSPSAWGMLYVYDLSFIPAFSGNYELVIDEEEEIGISIYNENSEYMSSKYNSSGGGYISYDLLAGEQYFYHIVSWKKLSNQAYVTISVLPDLILPASLTRIESQAFVGLPQTRNVFIPRTVTDIADDAFENDIVILTPSGSWAESWANSHGHMVVGQ